VTSTNHKTPQYIVLLIFPLLPHTWYKYPRPSAQQLASKSRSLNTSLKKVSMF